MPDDQRHHKGRGRMSGGKAELIDRQDHVVNIYMRIKGADAADAVLQQMIKRHFNRKGTKKHKQSGPEIPRAGKIHVEQKEEVEITVA